MNKVIDVIIDEKIGSTCRNDRILQSLRKTNDFKKLSEVIEKYVDIYSDDISISDKIELIDQMRDDVNTHNTSLLQSSGLSQKIISYLNELKMQTLDGHLHLLPVEFLIDRVPSGAKIIDYSKNENAMINELEEILKDEGLDGEFIIQNHGITHETSSGRGKDIFIKLCLKVYSKMELDKEDLRVAINNSPHRKQILKFTLHNPTRVISPLE